VYVYNEFIALDERSLTCFTFPNKTNAQQREAHLDIRTDECSNNSEMVHRARCTVLNFSIELSTCQ
jgi:hypothetical protein